MGVPCPEITPEQASDFAFAIMEYAGNVQMAYASVFGGNHTRTPVEAIALMRSHPLVIQRLRELQTLENDVEIVSKTVFVAQTAMIRDAAMAQGAVKVALQAHTLIGDVAGFVKQKEQQKTSEGLSVVVNLVGQNVPPPQVIIDQ